MKPICVPCQRFFRPKKNGFYFIEGMPVGPGRAAPGTSEPDKWWPYKLWVGDLWECHGCGANIVVGVAERAIAVRYMEEFPNMIKRFNPTLQVNDC